MRVMHAIAAASIFAVAASSAQAQEEFSLAGDAVAIFNLAGTVSVIPGSGNDVVVELTRGGQDGAELEVEMDMIRGKNSLRVIYPGDRVVYSEMGRRSSTDVRVNDDGTFFERRRSRGRKVEVRGGGRGLQAHADLVIRVPAGRSVSVYLAAGESTADGLDADLLLDVGSGQSTITDLRGSLNVDSGSGSVRVENVQGPEVSVDTGSGSVDIFRVRSDALSIDTGSGSVKGEDLVAGSVNVDTGSGRIELTGIESSDVICDTGSGRVTLSFDSDVDQLEVDTGSGSITVQVPENAGADFEIDTGSGSIDLDIPVRIQRSERTYARGEFGDGVGSIRLDTGSGSIRIGPR